MGDPRPMFPSNLEILTEVDFDPLIDQVFLVGSIADGWGNATSDIDIIVVSPAASRLQSISGYSVRLERWLDVRRMSTASIVDLRKNVELNASLPDEWGCHRVASLDLLDTFHRLARGRALSAAILADEKVKLCVNSLVRESSLTHLIISRARWEDAAGASMSGDPEQAAYVAEIGLWQQYATERSRRRMTIDQLTIMLHRLIPYFETQNEVSIDIVSPDDISLGSLVTDFRTLIGLQLKDTKPETVESVRQVLKPTLSELHDFCGKRGCPQICW